MKPIHVIGIALVTAFGIIWCVQIWSAGRWNTELARGEGNAIYDEAKREREDANASVHETFGDSSIPVNDATGVSVSSSEETQENIIDRWLRTIKSVVHRSRPAPPGVYFTLTYLSVRNAYGITGLEAGTQVICVEDKGPVLRVKAGNVEFEANRQYLTNDLDVAGLAVRSDAKAKQSVASYIAQQQQAIDQRDAKRKAQPSGQH